MLKGLGNLANLGSMLKQAQEMGSKMQGLSEELKKKRATGSSGGGLIEVEVNGAGEMLSIRVDPSLFEKQDREMVEDLIPAAVNQALAKAREMHAEAMQGLTEGMNLPGLQDAMSELTGQGPTEQDES